MRKLGWAFLALLALFFAVSMGNGRPKRASAPTAPVEDTAEYIVPVKGVARDQLIDSWHDARDGGARVHEALDIPAAAGTPVIAAMAGRVEKLFLSDAGGLTVYVRSTDGGTMAYYAHLQRYADGLSPGMTVAQGDTVGFVGDTGNAGAGNYHLHFALARMGRDEKWYQGTPVNPYPLLAGKPSAR